MQENTNPNFLINEKSPYLLQHAYNPVNWYPWGEKAFEKAKKKINQFSYQLATAHVTGVMSWLMNPLKMRK